MIHYFRAFPRTLKSDLILLSSSLNVSACKSWQIMTNYRNTCRWNISFLQLLILSLRMFGHLFMYSVQTLCFFVRHNCYIQTWKQRNLFLSQVVIKVVIKVVILHKRLSKCRDSKFSIWTKFKPSKKTTTTWLFVRLMQDFPEPPVRQRSFLRLQLETLEDNRVQIVCSYKAEVD